jgi:TRAP-type C4-dicarboxylate transport system permease small subunit
MRVLWTNLEKAIVVLTLLPMLLIVFAAVMGRYVFFYPIKWSEEVARWFIVWITFAGSAHGFKTGIHMNINVFTNLLPQRVQYVIRIFVRILTIVFFLILAYYGYVFTMGAVQTGQLAPATRLSMAIPFSAVPVGSILCVLRLLDIIIKEIRAGRPLEVSEL